MSTTYYTYSKFVGGSGAALFFGLMILLIVGGIIAPDNKVWYYVIPCELLPAGFLFYFSKYCLIPALQNCVALELDDEKLTYYITGQTIYWKDIVEISEEYSGNSSSISFDMVRDDEKLSISTKWISGSTTKICDKMQEYFARTL